MTAPWRKMNPDCKCMKCKEVRGEVPKGFFGRNGKHWEPYGAKRDVVPATEYIVDLRERLWALVPSIDRTTSFGRQLVTTRDAAGQMVWVEVDTFTEAELLALLEYYARVV